MLQTPSSRVLALHLLTQCTVHCVAVFCWCLPRVMHTASVWDMATMKVLKKVDLTGITDGLMEARWTGVPWLFWVSGGLGKL